MPANAPGAQTSKTRVSWSQAARLNRSPFDNGVRFQRHSLPSRSFHSLRHYFLSALVRGGANLEAVRERAGHSKLLTAQRYLHASGADLRDAVSRLPGNAKCLRN